MVEVIIWRKEAEKILDDMIAYLENEVSLTSAQNLARAVHMALEQLKDYPTIGRQSRVNEKVRFILVGRNRRMYYRVKGKKLIVIYLFDTRQDPNKDPYQ